MRPVISGAVEGAVDEAAFKRLVTVVGADPGPIYGKQGKAHLLSRVAGYNHAAARSPWLVILDLDRSAECAPEFVRTLPEIAPFMCLRVAVRSIESWILADVSSVCEWTGLSRAAVTVDVASLTDPKRHLIGLVQRSRRTSLIADVVPRLGAGRTEGPGYAGQMIDFFGTRWVVEAAAARCDSLAKAVKCLERLVERL